MRRLLIVLSAFMVAMLSSHHPARAQAEAVVAGVWKSDYGMVVLNVAADGAVTGHWNQPQRGVGSIFGGLYDPTGRHLTFSYSQPWNQAKGNAAFKLSLDNKTLKGRWHETSIENGKEKRSAGDWTLTRAGPR